jgi:hypothetical protein
MRQIFQASIKSIATEKLLAIESAFEADALFYNGDIFYDLSTPFAQVIEQLKAEPKAVDSACNRLVIILNTSGGSAEEVERIVRIIRTHYEEVYFVVPDIAMSAGTILCMSGDKIFMDYTSSLGPIDPQVPVGDKWVPAMGYLDEVEQLLAKKQLTPGEYHLLENQDIALLNLYKKAEELSISLLEKWLVKYKFKDWKTHASNPSLLGKPVSEAEKSKRAKEVGKVLSDIRTWKSHSRFIGIRELEEIVKLKIDDYSKNHSLRHAINDYFYFIKGYISGGTEARFLHTRHSI